jgi:hypothetical protein
VGWRNGCTFTDMGKKVNKARPWSYRVPVHLEGRLEAIADVSGLSVGKWTERLVVEALNARREAVPVGSQAFTDTEDWMDRQLPPGDRQGADDDTLSPRTTEVSNHELPRLNEVTSGVPETDDGGQGMISERGLSPRTPIVSNHELSETERAATGTHGATPDGPNHDDRGGEGTPQGNRNSDGRAVGSSPAQSDLPASELSDCDECGGTEIDGTLCPACEAVDGSPGGTGAGSGRIAGDDELSATNSGGITPEQARQARIDALRGELT